MERLTKRSSDTTKENGVCCTHFGSPECFMLEGNCSAGCKWEEAAWGRLADYEDTHMMPADVTSMRMDMAIIAALFNGVDVDRMKGLTEADKNGRVMIAPCKIGDTLYRVFAGEIFEHRVGSMKYFAIQGRWDIETYPFCPYVESSIGKTIFLTREEAENVLKEKKNVDELT